MDYSQFLHMREELSLVVVLLLLFLADLFMSPDAHKNDGKARLNTMLPVILMAVHTAINLIPGTAADVFGGMYHYVPMHTVVKSILNIGTLIVFLMAHEWMKREDTAFKQGEFYVLTLSTLFGMYLMISAGHFLMFFIGLETASIPMAALIAFDKYRHNSSEAGAKYILTALFSSALLLFGLSMIYAEGHADHPVLEGAGEQLGGAQRHEGHDVVQQDLTEEVQEGGRRGCPEAQQHLEAAVDEAGEQAPLHAVAEGHQHEGQHAQQGDAAAVGHREDLDVGQNGADGDHQRALHQNAGLGISFRHFGFAPLKIVHKNKMRPQQQTQRLRL